MYTLVIQQEFEDSHQQQLQISRTYSQLQWLHVKLTHSHPNTLIPPFPDTPRTNVSDADYAEKKRLQMARYLIKLFCREQVLDGSSDLQLFINDTAMAGLNFSNVSAMQVSKKSSLSSMLVPIFSAIGRGQQHPDYQRGFRVFHASEFIPGASDDADEFETRKSYIESMDMHFSSVLDKFGSMMREREHLNKIMLQLGYSLKMLDPESMSHAELDTIYQLMVDLRTKDQKQNRQSILLFGDVILEYKNTVPCLKTLMNSRTDALADYVDSLKNRAHASEELQKQRIARQDTTHAIDVLEESEQVVTKTKKGLDAVRGSLTHELVIFEKEKTRDLRKAMRAYAHIQIQFETEKLEYITRALNK